MTANLLSRLQGLEGPDREVDARIHYVLFPETEVLLDPGDMRTKRPGRYGPLSEMPMDCWTDFDAICHHIGAQPYTASLDAAVALCERVLPGWKKHMWDAGVFGSILPTAAVLEPDFVRKSIKGEPYIKVDGEGPTPAIALLIAILTALETRENG